MIKVGINGFGRIGRSIFRINEIEKNFDVVAINDVDPLIENHAYLLNYDSLYGSLDKKISVSGNSFVKDNGEKIMFFNTDKIDHVPWKDSGVDVVIDSSGIFDNVLRSHNLINKELKKVIVTHSPSKSIDRTLILAANEDSYNNSNDNVISSSICDANACAPVLRVLENEIGIIDGFITTLHPWLGYQNLLDGSTRSVSSPGHYWSDFALGRSSIDSLIPKPTTLVPALERVLPNLKNNLHAMSFRVPTSIVSASDIVLTLKKKTSNESIKALFKDLERTYPDVVLTNEESLVSIDFKGIKQSCVIDFRWIKTFGDKVKLVIWYDNEWGYSNRILDLIKLFKF